MVIDTCHPNADLKGPSQPQGLAKARVGTRLRCGRSQGRVGMAFHTREREGKRGGWAGGAGDPNTLWEYQWGGT